MLLAEAVVDERDARGATILMEQQRQTLTLRGSLGDILLEIEKRYIEPGEK